MAERVQSKETAPKTGKAKPGRKQQGTSPAPPSSKPTTRVQTRYQKLSEAIESDSLPERKQDAVAVHPHGLKDVTPVVQFFTTALTAARK